MKSLYATRQNNTFSHGFLNLLIIGSVSVFLSACAAGPSSSATQVSGTTKTCTVEEPTIGSNFSKHKPCRVMTEEERRQTEQQARDMIDDQMGRTMASKSSN
ncbi:hypothetical protein [Aquirhabdus sp.]|uniref:hypothetical protein n=1 Tax=Aquirhabdus sp. TaxID=2824160 RepID=UPI00396C8225